MNTSDQDSGRRARREAFRALLAKAPLLYRSAQELEAWRRHFLYLSDAEKVSIRQRISENLKIPDIPMRRRMRGDV